jgi:hypothetical protein
MMNPCCYWALQCLLRPKECPGFKRDVPWLQCSGHGSCFRFPANCSDGVGNCLASCRCDAGWGGVDCGWSANRSALINVVRQQLIQGVVSVVMSGDGVVSANPAASLLSSVTGSSFIFEAHTGDSLYEEVNVLDAIVKVKRT